VKIFQVALRHLNRRMSSTTLLRYSSLYRFGRHCHFVE
jgi:hypothetical protein